MALRLAIAQFNAAVGDIQGNSRQISEWIKKAQSSNVDLLVFPEMSLCGYPPEDLLFKPHFLKKTREAINDLARSVGDIKVAVGFANLDKGQTYNSLAVIGGGKIERVYNKIILPNYGVFDEQRYFIPGTEPMQLEINGLGVLFTICEDIWETRWLDSYVRSNSSHPDLIINCSASPFNLGKLAGRVEVLTKCAKRFKTAVAYCNLVGGQDELIFDGRSMLIDQKGIVAAEAKVFEQDWIIAEIDKPDDNGIEIKMLNAASKYPEQTRMSTEAEIYGALVLGTRDYLHKNGFKKAVIGLSGGIDSSITAAVAVDALGAENVMGVTMPSRFNSAETRSDAEKLARNLGIEFYNIPIGPTLDSFSEMLSAVPSWDEKGLAYENLQARIRGSVLMSISNQFGHMVLTTGNKSETAVGYSTLYGDTAGGFAVIKDVPKTMVYKLSEYVNVLHGREIIPRDVITRPPSAELRDDQKDSDSLPDYDTLDAILKAYVEQDLSAGEIINRGLDEQAVKRVIKLVDRNEYKRRQCPPGVRITPKAFGKDRRMPITNRFNP